MISLRKEQTKTTHHPASSRARVIEEVPACGRTRARRSDQKRRCVQNPIQRTWEPNGAETNRGVERRGKVRKLRAGKIDERRRITGRASRHRLAGIGNGCTAAIVCLRGGGALPLHTALGRFTRRSSERKTVERP